VFSDFETSKSPYKIYFWGIIIGGIIVLLNSFVNLLVLGVRQASVLYFPYYSTISRIDINFLERIEIIIAFVFVLGGFIKMSVCLLATCKGLSKVFGFKDYRFLVIPVACSLLNFSYYIFDSIMDFLDWSINIWPYYSFLFQVIIPIIILIISEIRQKINPSTTNHYN